MLSSKRDSSGIRKNVFDYESLSSMLKLKKEGNKLSTVLFDFEELVRRTILTASKLVEYFRMNLIYYQLISGKGLEFDRIKEYSVGQDPKRIDWKKFAKTGKLFIRAFKEERRFDVVVVMDVSNSMLLGTAEFTKNQYAAVIAGALGFAAGEAGDLIGLTMHSSQVSASVDPSNEFFRMLNVISQKENYGGEKDWENLSKVLVSNYSEETIIFLISDFIDTNVEKFLPDIASHFSKVYGIMIRDPIDDELPDGVGRTYLKDTAGLNPCLVNLEKLKEEYRILNLRNVEKVKEGFHNYGQLFFKIRTDEEFSTGFVKALGSEEVIIY